MAGIQPIDVELDGAVSRTVMFYRCENAITPCWLTFFEEIFAAYGVDVYEATGGAGEKRSHGRYGRVKKRLSGFLSGEHDTFDIRLRSEPTVEHEFFFPCDVEVCLIQKKNGDRKGHISVRDTLVNDCNALIDKIGSGLFDLIGATYAGVWDFPTRFGSEGYLSSVGSMPRGVHSMANKEYSARITRWRNNTLRKGLSARQGFFREIYPINFVLQSHLNMPFNDCLLSEFMESSGKLWVPYEGLDLYRWDVPSDKLEFVREALETSGLVLSSEAEPIAIH